MKTLREYIDQLDEISRRGFLKGVGAAAGLTAMGYGVDKALQGGDVPTGPGMDITYLDYGPVVDDSGFVLPKPAVDNNLRVDIGTLRHLGLNNDATFGQVIQAMKKKGYPDHFIKDATQQAVRRAKRAQK